MLGQDAYAPSLRQPRRDLGEVVSDLGARCSFVEAGVLAGMVDPVLAERQGVDAVVGRGGVQPNEGIRVEPMATRTGPAIDQRELDIGVLLDQLSAKASALAPDPTTRYSVLIRSPPSVRQS